VRCLPLKEENHGEDKRKGKHLLMLTHLIFIKNCLDVCTWVYALIALHRMLYMAVS
jgi:hypothetical protein